MNKPVYLGLAILEISEIVLYKFLYDYLKTKYGENAKSCYKDTNRFIFYIKTEDIYVDITKDVETRFVTLNYSAEKSIPYEQKLK